jgi:glycosyltransferase involved in cell wall biosynthesis
MQRKPDLICFSHLRWDHVFQRPNHLMTQCSRERRVFFFEEPTIDPAGAATSVRAIAPNLYVVKPVLAPGADVVAGQREALFGLCKSWGIGLPIRWFQTPMALEFARPLEGSLTIYDCMDELSAFRGAPAGLGELERELMARADLVFTGGASLFEAKRALHRSVHLFPSSVDAAHFAQARQRLPVPQDQASIGCPRIGFFGVIDERMDLGLVQGVARARPSWHFVLVGPVAKLDPSALPQEANIHYLGHKQYQELPRYLSGWDVAIMPFALNEATRFISPTKTLEYLAGGKPVVSTPVRDVVKPYGELGMVRIAPDVDSFVRAIEAASSEGSPRDFAELDAFIARHSWRETWARMSALISESLSAAERAATVE